MSDDVSFFGGIVAIVLAALLGLFIVVGIPIWVGTYYSQRSSCSNWGEETNRTVKFEVLVQPLGIPIEWDCFTTSGDGSWVPRNRVREIDS